MCILLNEVYYNFTFPSSLPFPVAIPIDSIVNLQSILTMQDMPVGQLQLSRESLMVGEEAGGEVVGDEGGGVVGEVGGGGSQV